MKIKHLTSLIWLALIAFKACASSDDVVFNTDVLDVNDRKNIDLSEFSKAGYIMPGSYLMSIRLNQRDLDEETVSFFAPDDDPKGSEVCLTSDLVKKIGFTADIINNAKWWHNGKCFQISGLHGAQVHGDLSTATVDLSIPQAYLEYSSDDWDPPSRWDEGVPGIIVDYNLTGTRNHNTDLGGTGQYLSGNGTVGANYGEWRVRGDWQGERSKYSHEVVNNWQWSRLYAYRPITSLRSKLIIGENNLSSDIFDTFKYSGINLSSDDSQLPPNLRGYAPEVSGIARTTAQVTVSQQGRIIYQTQVAPGPFEIKDINSSTKGTLDVSVQEQDGSVQKFQVNAASVPYLSRPGRLRYKLTSGKPEGGRHDLVGPLFASGEFSYGINNGWSVYGGLMLSNVYTSLSSGVGRDLLNFGAVSFDVTTSSADYKNGKSSKGNSYRLSYSKTFDSINSQIAFAGYRFSEHGYVSMDEFIDSEYLDYQAKASKDKYSISFIKDFADLNLTTNFDFSKEDYWDKYPANERYTFTLSKFFDVGSYKNISLSLSAFRSQYYNEWDKGGYLNISIPLMGGGTMSYAGSSSSGKVSNSISYYNKLGDNDFYQVSAGKETGATIGSGYFTHEGDAAEVELTAGYESGRYTSAGVSLRGGATLTKQGFVAHRIGTIGGTRMIIDADGIKGVPVSDNGTTIKTNYFGLAAVTSLTSYYRNKFSIDLDHLDQDIEIPNSLRTATLTEGAIGLRKFEVIKGEKSFVTIRLKDGKAAPFGAIVTDSNNRQTGMVGDGGYTWLTGMEPKGIMDVQWGGRKQCSINLPEKISGNMLLLPCQ